MRQALPEGEQEVADGDVAGANVGLPELQDLPPRQRVLTNALADPLQHLEERGWSHINVCMNRQLALFGKGRELKISHNVRNIYPKFQQVLFYKLCGNKYGKYGYGSSVGIASKICVPYLGCFQRGEFFY